MSLTTFADSTPSEHASTTLVRRIADSTDYASRVSFRGFDKRGCALLGDNTFAFVLFELCRVAGMDKHYCRVTQLDLVRRESSDDGAAPRDIASTAALPSVTAFEVDDDEVCYVGGDEDEGGAGDEANVHENQNEKKTEQNSAENDNNGDDDTNNNVVTSSVAGGGAKSGGQQEQQQQEEEKGVATLSNIQLTACKTGILIWRPGKCHHIFLRLADLLAVQLRTSDDVIATQIVFPGVYFLTRAGTIEAFHLERVSATLGATRSFSAKLSLPAVDQQHLLLQLLMTSRDCQQLDETTRNNNENNNNNTNNNNNNHSLASAPSQFALSGVNAPSAWNHSVRSTTSRRQSHSHHTQQQHGRRSGPTHFHAVSFCHVPSNSLMTMRDWPNVFIIQVGETRDLVYVAQLPSIDLVHVSREGGNNNDADETATARSGTSTRTTTATTTTQRQNESQRQSQDAAARIYVGARVDVTGHAIPLLGRDRQSQLESVSLFSTSTSSATAADGGGDGSPVPSPSSTSTAPPSPSAATAASPSSSFRQRYMAPLLAATHVCIIDAYAGSYCLSLIRSNTAQLEMYNFSEHCLLKALLLGGGSENNNNNNNNNHASTGRPTMMRNYFLNSSSSDNYNTNESQQEEEDHHSAMYLYHTEALQLLSPRTRLGVSIAASLQNPNMFIVTLDSSSSVSASSAVCVPVYDRARRGWAASPHGSGMLGAGTRDYLFFGRGAHPPMPSIAQVNSSSLTEMKRTFVLAGERDVACFDRVPAGAASDMMRQQQQQHQGHVTYSSYAQVFFLLPRLKRARNDARLQSSPQGGGKFVRVCCNNNSSENGVAGRGDTRAAIESGNNAAPLQLTMGNEAAVVVPSSSPTALSTVVVDPSASSSSSPSLSLAECAGLQEASRAMAALTKWTEGGAVSSVVQAASGHVRVDRATASAFDEQHRQLQQRARDVAADGSRAAHALRDEMQRLRSSTRAHLTDTAVVARAEQFRQQAGASTMETLVAHANEISTTLRSLRAEMEAGRARVRERRRAAVRDERRIVQESLRELETTLPWQTS